MSPNLEELSDSELTILLSDVLAERSQRLHRSENLDVMLDEAMQEMFTYVGDPRPPAVVGSNMIAIAGMVNYRSATKHACSLSTIRVMDGEADIWSWDNTSDSFLQGDSTRVGKLRRSVDLHQAIEGMIITQHIMTHNGERHNRSRCSAWRIENDCDEDGVVIPMVIPLTDYVPSRLPPPHGDDQTKGDLKRSGQSKRLERPARRQA